MKLVITSDLHQRIAKWDDLVSVVETQRPRFVLIAGDLLPKGTFKEQKKFFGEMRKLLHKMKQFGQVTILTYLGNDDAHLLEPLLDEVQAEGRCINLNGRVHREKDLVFCGMNKVRDYPFGYKHWCASDGDYVACAEQLCGEGLTLDHRGNYVRLANLVKYLSAKPSIGDELDRLADEATTETLHLEASTHEELLGKIRVYAELANRKGFMVDRITTETEKHDEAGSRDSSGC